MFTFSFWVLAIWFVINVIWMWFKLSDQKLQKTFAWINVVALIWGFWAYNSSVRVGGIATWFNVINYVNIIVALLQFYFGYRKLDK
ncbi:hypothetical protein [Liquorilactobacillus vini]|uniref:MtN3 and saliva related transmembrane protein n=1 Tax=Liquorilactobacillus vini DSM 20605 TaxID=1133569 RepID=A0A0R2CDA4_9LACO|nr:hypothetical protein [Liquorilactobacillus vini]KRM89074.1 hypothetical protein FD21_GL000337 [Liquorilactobacillus vini DSM 20605]